MKNYFLLLLLAFTLPAIAQSRKSKSKAAAPAANPVPAAPRNNDERSAAKNTESVRQELAPLMARFPVLESSNHGQDLEYLNQVITSLIDKQSIPSENRGKTPAQENIGMVSANKDKQPDDFSWFTLSKESRAQYEETGLDDFYAVQLKAFNTVKVFNTGPVYMPRPDGYYSELKKTAEDEQKAEEYYGLLYRWAATYPALFYALPGEWQKLLASKNKTMIFQKAKYEASLQPL